MQIKRFEAKDITEALRQVKEKLGPEAVILSTKTIKSAPRPYGGTGTRIEVVAAVDFQDGKEDFIPKPEIAPLRPFANRPQAGTDLFSQRVLSSGLYPEFVQGLMAEWKRLGKDSPSSLDPGDVQSFLRGKLMEAVDVASPEAGGMKIWAFVGPTGVGKTTTLAKLAAYFHLRLGKKIGLITIDTYRIGALDQLQTYARILRLPLEIAPDRESLKKIIDRSGHCDLLLIDTAGRNPYRLEQLEEMQSLLGADQRIEAHLVLSATTKDRDLEEIVRRFSILPLHSYIFTKIDETVEYTSLFNQLMRYRKPLSYLATGQKVPEDIEVATKGRVANLVVNNLNWN